MDRKRWTGCLPRTVVSCVMLLALTLIPGCANNSPTNPDLTDASGTLVNHGECKYMETSSTMDGTPPNLDCIYFDYDGIGRLNLLHVNGAFNCCPEMIYAVVSIEGNSITIKEFETDGQCECVCLYDLEYLIEDLPPGPYQLTVEGCWLPGSEAPLVCQLDLAGVVSGECCIERTSYPWG